MHRRMWAFQDYNLATICHSRIWNGRHRSTTPLSRWQTERLHFLTVGLIRWILILWAYRVVIGFRIATKCQTVIGWMMIKENYGNEVNVTSEMQKRTSLRFVFKINVEWENAEASHPSLGVMIRVSDRMVLKNMIGFHRRIPSCHSPSYINERYLSIGMDFVSHFCIVAVLYWC